MEAPAGRVKVSFCSGPTWSPAVVGRGMRILVIEDDRTLARTLCRVLAPEHRPSLAPTFQSALEQLQNDRFDLILLDLELPDSPRADTPEKIFSLLSQISAVCPVFGMSGYRDAGAVFREAAARAGRPDSLFFDKPFAIEEVIEAVQAVDPLERARIRETVRERAEARTRALPMLFSRAAALMS